MAGRSLSHPLSRQKHFLQSECHHVDSANHRTRRRFANHVEMATSTSSAPLPQSVKSVKLVPTAERDKRMERTQLMMMCYYVEQISDCPARNVCGGHQLKSGTRLELKNAADLPKLMQSHPLVRCSTSKSGQNINDIIAASLSISCRPESRTGYTRSTPRSQCSKIPICSEYSGKFFFFIWKILRRHHGRHRI